MIELRVAAPGDERLLAALDRETWSPQVAPVPLWGADVDFFAKDAPDDVLVAVDRGAVVGYVKLRRPTSLPSNQHVRQIGGLAVDPGRQRRGIGRRLVAGAVHEARRRGARRLTLHVLATNTAARALYAAAGFRTEGVRRGEFLLAGQHVDDVLMALALDQPRPPRP